MLGDPKNVLEQFTSIAGWNEESQIQLLCDFILSKGLTKELQAFLVERAEAERAATDL